MMNVSITQRGNKSAREHHAMGPRAAWRCVQCQAARDWADSAAAYRQAATPSSAAETLCPRATHIITRVRRCSRQA
eukprot:5418230-Prymnesium_polylepis.1